MPGASWSYWVYTMRQASRGLLRIGQTRPVKVVFIAYRNSLQADALKLVAKKLRSHLLAVEGELPEDGPLAHGDYGDDLMLALARKIVSGEEEDAESVEDLFAQALDDKASAAEYLLDDDWKQVQVEPEAVNRNGYGHHDAIGIRPSIELVLGNGHARGNGNGPHDEDPEPQSRCSLGRSLWPRSRSSPGAGADNRTPQPRPCSTAGWKWRRRAGKSRPAWKAKRLHKGRPIVDTSDRPLRFSSVWAFLAFRDTRLVQPVADDLGLSQMKRRSKQSTTRTNYNGQRASGDRMRFPIAIRRQRHLATDFGLMAPPSSRPRQHPNVPKQWRALFRSKHYFGIIGNRNVESLRKEVPKPPHHGLPVGTGVPLLWILRQCPKEVSHRSKRTRLG